MRVDEAMIRERRKTARLIGDTASGLIKLGLRAPEGAVRSQRDAALAELLPEIQVEKNAATKGSC